MKKKILIVDDDVNLVRGLGVRLKSIGYHVIIASDGISAISTAKRERPDLIVLDLCLPAGDGFSVMKRLTSIVTVASIPVIVITGTDPSTTKQQALQAGARAFFIKPFDDKELIDAIQHTLGDSETDEDHRNSQRGRNDSKGQGKVLIVDDDKNILQALNVRLSAAGYDIVVAMDGMSAVKMAQKENPDLILLDIGLPAGDGFVVMERLSSLPIPIVILTARDASTTRNKALKAGAVAYFQKPFDSQELLTVMQKTLDEYRDSIGVAF